MTAISPINIQYTNVEPVYEKIKNNKNISPLSQPLCSPVLRRSSCRCRLPRVTGAEPRELWGAGASMSCGDHRA